MPRCFRDVGEFAQLTRDRSPRVLAHALRIGLFS